MRDPASEKLEIIRLVEESALPVRWTLEKIGIPRATFYRWYDLYQAGGPEALDDRHSKPCGTHSRPISWRAGRTCACGHTKIESTVRYLGIEVDDALAIAEQVD